MKREPAIEFVLSDRVDGVEITPATIGLSRFNEFNQQVQEFLSGSGRLKVDEVHVSVETGSYKLVALLPVILQAALEPDLRSLSREDALGEIDPKRAEIVQKWQARSKASPDLRYAIRPDGFPAEAIEVSRSTDYRVGEIVPWVKVEKYLFGTIMNIGGVQRANVHLRLEDSGQLVVIGSSQGYLKGNDRLYHKVLVRVEADQHFKTGELRNLRLLSFEGYEPGYNESALDEFVAAGSKAWADVPDAAGWVRGLRGGSV
jgi:hypothetical protein